MGNTTERELDDPSRKNKLTNKVLISKKAILDSLDEYRLGPGAYNLPPVMGNKSVISSHKNIPGISFSGNKPKDKKKPNESELEGKNKEKDIEKLTNKMKKDSKFNIHLKSQKLKINVIEKNNEILNQNNDKNKVFL